MKAYTYTREAVHLLFKGRMLPFEFHFLLRSRYQRDVFSAKSAYIAR